MINNWKHHELYMDFSNINVYPGRPSDIDMFYIGKHNFLIIGEIKNGELCELKEGQRNLLERLINNWKYDGVILYITHDKMVENGDRKVDVSKCKVEEYYYKGKWRIPKQYTEVQNAFDKLINKTKEKSNEYRM